MHRPSSARSEVAQPEGLGCVSNSSSLDRGIVVVVFDRNTEVDDPI
jgi:hypothetical protein